MILWVGLLGGPVARFGQMTAGYALAEWACHGHGRWPLHLATVVGLALAAGGIAASWWIWDANGRGWPSPTDEGRAARDRFLAVMGLLAGSLFTLIILAQWV